MDERPDQPASEVLPPTARAVTMEELYVSSPRPAAEGSWAGNLLLVALALAATVAILEGVFGYHVW